MFKKSLFSCILALFIVPTAFADEALAEDPVAGGGDASAICYDCGYTNGISFTVSSVVNSTADKILLYGTYTVYELESKKDAINELNTAFSTLRSATSKYGVLTRSSVYTYSDWQYTNLYDGSLSVRLELTNHGAYETVQNIFYDNNFDIWTDIQVLNPGAIEKSAVADLKSQIADQKNVYEQILDYTLGRITGLSMYTSVDSSTFDSDTNTVDVTVWATISYDAQE